MIATILPSTSSFHAVLYNENKVKHGDAHLLEIKNFGSIDILGYDDPKQLQKYLVKYSARNSRVKKPQFHIAFSCKGHEWTYDQLLAFAHDYLDEMGYGDPEQPLLVYAHNDTDNNHIHVITSRVAPDGKRIKDFQERVLSQKVIEKLLGKNTKLKADKDLDAALSFDFKTITQFKAIMEAMKYQCYEKNNHIYIKKGGSVVLDVPSAAIQQRIEINNKSRDESDQSAQLAKWNAIFKKYKDLNFNKNGLEEDLKQKFGLSLVWFGKKDSPYGYAVVDFNAKKVYEGSKIMPVKALLDFQTTEQVAENIELLIYDCLEDNFYVTTSEINRKLKRMGGRVKGDCVVIKKQQYALSPMISARLKRNDKIAFLNEFQPMSEMERKALCRLNDFSAPDLVTLSKGNSKLLQIGNELRRIASIDNQTERCNEMHKRGFSIIDTEDGSFVYNKHEKFISESGRLGLTKEDVSLLRSSSVKIPMERDVATAARQPNKADNVIKKSPIGRGMNYGGRSDNREWEVGKKESDKDDMDRKQGFSW